MFPIRTNVPTRHEAFLTWAIIGANVLIFLYEESLSPSEQAALLSTLRCCRRDIRIAARV